MNLPFLFAPGLPPWPTMLVPTVGFVTASLALFSCFLLVRHRRRARNPDREQAELHDPFDQGALGERRIAPRRKGNRVEILVTDAEAQGEPVLGWVVERSMSGLSLMLSEELAEGAILSVKPRQHPPGTPWVRIQVRNCKRDPDGFLLGCEFERVPPWGVLLLFG